MILLREAEPPSTVAERGGSVPKSAWAELAVLCLTAMHKDLQRRYRSTEALIRDIDHYLKGAPGFIGLDQINVQIPQTAPTGTVIVLLQSPSLSAANPLTIGIQ
jgi:hypothetical protein